MARDEAQERRAQAARDSAAKAQETRRQNEKLRQIEAAARAQREREAQERRAQAARDSAAKAQETRRRNEELRRQEEQRRKGK